MPASVPLPGDGIGPEIMKPALELLRTISEDFSFEEHLFGGAAIDVNGVALADATPAPRTRARALLRAISEDFAFEAHLSGGAAIAAPGVALADETLAACKRADAVLLAAV